MRLCVFCGSSPGNQPVYLEAAQQLGTALAKAGIGLVYGGAQVGLMGAVADAALAAGGEVLGVIPRQLVERELAHSGLTELREVGSMHERKAIMADLSDGFIALPGGVGTFEEVFDLGSARPSPEALRAVQCARLLRQTDRLPRPLHERRLYETTLPGNADCRSGCGIGIGQNKSLRSAHGS